MGISPLVKEKIKEELLKIIESSRKDDYVKISSERELAQIFAVSRTTIRSVIKELIEEGMLVQIQGKGTYITPKTEKFVYVLNSPDLKSDDPFYSKFFVELTNKLTKKGFNLNFISMDRIARKKDKEVPVLIIGVINDGTIEKLKNNFRYLISIEQYFNHDEIIQISVDDYRIGWSAAEALIKRNHDYIIHLCGPERYTAPRLRKLGFWDRVKIEPKVKYEIIEGKMNYKSGYELGEKVLEIFNKEKRSKIGIFAANDWMAIGLMQRLKEAGVIAGRDLSVIGCDDVPLSTEVVPNLTTFKWDIEKIVEEILGVLSDIINKRKSVFDKRVLVPAEFVIRQTLMD
ncbi:GntR family transcriptional regulator [Dictyoglomus thermophilum]|uniref:Transcriptional regulator, GntR family protein n=1 Tax=Dictyoglomus thermophilum (strain ATCC 35947 / DSM 3960 / H-6-12) TaxID=309799 RepID=B5YDG2_DICT6|nr:substrate-binding domain-containing protein [Dictyoglomus thermophilum]ACI19658.1 transcriptional regulator, GntR family protein [Dictyoglomus thermophilum H-6-12]